MKLLFCRRCQDVFKIIKIKKVCMCGSSEANYENERLVNTSGPSIVVGVENRSFFDAASEVATVKVGVEFNACVMPNNSKTINRVRNE